MTVNSCPATGSTVQFLLHLSTLFSNSLGRGGLKNLQKHHPSRPLPPSLPPIPPNIPSACTVTHLPYKTITKMALLPLLTRLLPLLTPTLATNSTFTNPILPGWHSDPSCIYHSSSSTSFCATSTFIAFPGLPIYASKDLLHWKLISHVWNREAQLSGLSWGTPGQQDGLYAPTLRFHDGEFWVVCEWIGGGGGGQVLTGLRGVLFRSGDPVVFDVEKIDPDLFWDDDGKLYVATQSVILQELDWKAGKLSLPPASLWNGIGGVWPEGPHIKRMGGII